MPRPPLPPTSSATPPPAAESALDRAAARRVRRWNWYLQLWRLHRWLGIGFGAVIVVVSLSGSALVLAPELERLVHRERHVLPAPLAPDAPRAEPAAVLATLIPLAPPGFRPLRLEPAPAPDHADKVVFISDDGANRRWSATVHPGSGAVLWHGHDQSLLRPWLLHLHEKLHAENLGYLVVGAASLALTLLGLSGILLTRDRLRVLVRSPLRLRLGWRVVLSDLHKWLGLVGSYFTIVLGATGLWFAFYIVPPILKGAADEPLAPRFDFAHLAPVLSAIAAARAEFPGAEIARVIFPWDEDVNLQVRMLHREAPVWEKLSRVDFDPVSGDKLRVRRATDATTAQKLASILGPLHFGTYGSAFTRWAYALGGLTPAALAVTGTLIWLRRRSQAKGKIR